MNLLRKHPEDRLPGAAAARLWKSDQIVRAGPASSGTASSRCCLRPSLVVLSLAVIGGLPAGPSFAEPTGVSATSVGSQAAVDWPQWRGPSRDGFVAPGTDWPERLDERHLRKSWSVDLGPSYSGPIVAADRVFVTETQEARNEVVRALERTTGKELWRAQWAGSMRVPFFAMSNGSWIRATPAYDGDALYVAGMRDLLVCLDAASGRERWRVDFVSEFETPLPSFGFVSSPLVIGNHIYVQAGSAFRKLDKQNGQTIWAALSDSGGMYGSAFSSPVLANMAGREQLVVQSREQLAGVDPESGGLLWSRPIKSFRGMNILTPSISGDTIFTSSYGGKAWLFRVLPEGDTVALDEVWTDNTEAYMSTPVIIDNHAYLHLKNRRMTCFDLRTGQRKWTSKPFGKYLSLVANGDRILALDERGDLLLIRATPEKFDLLESRKVSTDTTWAHLAVCGNEVFVRELGAMTAYRWDAPE